MKKYYKPVTAASSSILYLEKEIKSRVNELAEQIASDYRGQELLLVGVLKGSYVFLSDLQRALFKKGLDTTVDFMTVSSYTGTSRSQKTYIIQDLITNIQDLNILIVEDIIDSGRTLMDLKNHLLIKNPKSLKIVTLLDKKEKREVEIKADYTGFILSGSPWVEGYGMDSNELSRGNPDIVSKS